jgi:uncharacterized protein YjiS (DUF1127 family)
MTADVHRGWIEDPLLRAGSVIARTLRAGLKSIQYGQMISVLNRLPDTYLNEAGLRRCDIPEHARRSVYGDD